MATATIQTIPTELATTKYRISTIDTMRGIVMVIMALDHSRDFFHEGAVGMNPTDMQTTTPFLFFTRWVTHYCAPTFVFLAGTSIYLASLKKTASELSAFLLTRGLWLIVLEVVVIRFAILFNFYYDMTFLQVIWVIGASMICMALLIHLPYYVVLGLAFIIMFGHNVSDLWPLQPDDQGYALWAVLRQTGLITLSPGHNVFVIYPLLPWLAIMMMGYCLGKLYSPGFDVDTRRKWLLNLGAAAIVLFLILRLINLYGDASPWSSQKNALFTLMSFLNTTKYPVSLLYSLMTLGPMMMILAWMEKRELTIFKPFTVFGRVPLFYYVLHFYLIHAIGLLLFMNKTGVSFSEIDFHIGQSFGGLTSAAGYSLFWTYLLWLGVVVSLYPLCKWYNRYKSTHQHWWLSYV